MSENKEQEKIKKIKKYLEKSGFPLEVEIGNILRKKVGLSEINGHLWIKTPERLGLLIYLQQR